MSSVLMLVDLPKPMHGMSSINFQMLQLCHEKDVLCTVINTVPSYAARFFGTRLWSLLKLFHTLMVCFRLVFCLFWHRPSVVYRSLNGGNGQVYDLLFLTILRYSNAQVVLHHHSFSYLHSSSILLKLVCRLLKSTDRHIVLGEIMRLKLVERYSLLKDNILIISNLSFFSYSVPSLSSTNQDKPLRVTHLANLSFEKGLKCFVETVVELSALGITLEARLAGPCSTSQVAEYVEFVCQKYDFLHYCGPVYNHEKKQFFLETDLFVFPSHYVNEAEPLVLYEAAQFGAFLAGTSRGCMSDQIHRFGGFCYPDDTQPKEVALKLKSLALAQSFNQEAKDKRLHLFKSEQVASCNNLNSFVQCLKDGYVPKSTEFQTSS